MSSRVRVSQGLSKVAVVIVIALIVATIGVGASLYTLYNTKSVHSTEPLSTPNNTVSPNMTSPQPNPQIQATLTILAASGDPVLAPYLELVASDFMKAHPNVKVEVRLVPFAQLVQTALTALQNQNPSPDVIIFYPSQAPTLGPYLVDMRRYLDSGIFNKSDIPFSSMLPVYLLDEKGNLIKISGIPFQQVFGYVIIYRKSIFENQQLALEFKNKYGFDLNPNTWTSWDQMIKAAEFIHSKRESLGIKYALLFPNGLTLSIFNGFIGIFYSYALQDPCTEVAPGSIPGYWIYFKEVNGKIVPTLNCTAGIKALETYKKLVQFQPPIDVQAMEYDQLRDFFLTGDYAMVVAWTSFIPIYNNASISKVAGDIGVAPLPGGASGQAPTFAGINPYSKYPDLAAKLIAMMISPEEYRKGAEQIGFIPATYTGLKVASEVPATSWVKPFIKIVEEQRTVDLKRFTIVSRITNFFTELRPIFINNVAEFLRGKQSAEETMNNIVSDWIKIMKIA
ncbi:MAG: extracellular solute-binding protein [Sulfolobales archaeon]